MMRMRASHGGVARKKKKRKKEKKGREGCEYVACMRVLFRRLLGYAFLLTVGFIGAAAAETVTYQNGATGINRHPRFYVRVRKACQ
jgi:hypothetical protein